MNLMPLSGSVACDSLVVYCTMAYPDNRERRNRLFAYLAAAQIADNAAVGEFLEIDPDGLRHLLNGPPIDEVIADATRSMERGWRTGELLFLQLVMERAGVVPSLNKAITSQLQRTGECDGTVWKGLKKYKSVAHLWAASITLNLNFLT